MFFKMQNSFKIEVAKMKSLMERMEKPLTNFQATLNEEKYINEAKKVQRTEFNDIIELLWNSNFQRAKFVGIGYVIKPEIPKSIFPSEENSQTIDALDGSHDEELVGKIRAFKDNPKWGKIMSGKGKSSSFRGNDLNIIAVATYNLQWQNGSKFNQWYNERMKGEDAINKKWGINPLDYEQNKEANKEKMSNRIFYAGQFKNGEQPIFGGRIGSSKNGEIARYADGSEKLALKHVASFVNRGKTHYFYQKDDGSYVEISKDIVHFLTYKLGGKQAKNVINQVEQEAQSYEEELRNFRSETSKLIKMFSLRQIGYLTATVVNPTTQEKIPVAYVNQNVDPSESSKGFAVNAQTLYPKLQQLAQVAAQETENQANEVSNA